MMRYDVNLNASNARICQDGILGYSDYLVQIPSDSIWKILGVHFVWAQSVGVRHWWTQPWWNDRQQRELPRMQRVNTRLEDLDDLQLFCRGFVFF